MTATRRAGALRACMCACCCCRATRTCCCLLPSTGDAAQQHRRQHPAQRQQQLQRRECTVWRWWSCAAAAGWYARHQQQHGGRAQRQPVTGLGAGAAVAWCGARRGAGEQHGLGGARHVGLFAGGAAGRRARGRQRRQRHPAGGAAAQVREPERGAAPRPRAAQPAVSCGAAGARAWACGWAPAAYTCTHDIPDHVGAALPCLLCQVGGLVLSGFTSSVGSLMPLIIRDCQLVNNTPGAVPKQVGHAGRLARHCA